MHCKQWIFDMDGTLTDSMTVVWEGAPDALLRRYGRTPGSDTVRPPAFPCSAVWHAAPPAGCGHSGAAVRLSLIHI